MLLCCITLDKFVSRFILLLEVVRISPHAPNSLAQVRAPRPGNRQTCLVSSRSARRRTKRNYTAPVRFIGGSCECNWCENSKAPRSFIKQSSRPLLAGYSKHLSSVPRSYLAKYYRLKLRISGLVASFLSVIGRDP